MATQSENIWERFIKPGIELLTLVVSLIGLVSIWIAISELRKNQQTTSIGAYQAIEGLSLESDKLLVEYPALFQYFKLGKQIETTAPEYNQVVALADARIGIIDAALTYAAVGHIENSIEDWNRKFAHDFKSSRVMCERLASTREEYSILVVDLGEAACK